MKRWGRPLALLLSAAALAVVAFHLSFETTGRIDFWRHRDRYEEVVRNAIKGRPACDPGHECPVSTDGVVAEALHDGAGQYTVSLSVYDHHHWGRWGYLYSDEPPRRIEGDTYADVNAPGGSWRLGPQVAPHWWVISNNLD